MVSRLCRIAFLLLILIASAEASAADQCQGLKFEQVHSLSLQDVARMTQQKVISGQPGALAFIPFDEEDHPQHGKLRALGLIYARVGDLGEIPIGGYVWVSSEIHSSTYDVRKSANTVSILFHAQNAQQCKTRQLEFELRQMGKVYVNGVLVGTIR
jgi:hypothetical protein